MRHAAFPSSRAVIPPTGEARGIAPRRAGSGVGLARASLVAGALALGTGLLGVALAGAAEAASEPAAKTAPLPPSRPGAKADPSSDAPAPSAKPSASKSEAAKSSAAKPEASKPVASKPAPANPAPVRAASVRLPKGGVPLPLPRPAELVALDEAARAEEEAAARQARAEPASAFAFPPLFAPAPPKPEEREEVAPKEREKAEQPPSSEAPAAPAQKHPGLPAACAALVEEGTISAEPELHLDVKDGCNLPAPVRFSAIRLKDGRLVPLKPAAILRCEMVAAVADWVREDLAPAIAAQGSPLSVLEVAASFACRSRNNVKGAKVSEHGFGNALDVGGFATAADSELVVKNSGLPVAFQKEMKASACKRFATVLGPGSDGYHEDHIHVDLAQRRNDFKMCRWVIKDKTAPQPQPRPAEPATADGEGKAPSEAAAAEGKPAAKDAGSDGAGTSDAKAAKPGGAKNTSSKNANSKGAKSNGADSKGADSKGAGSDSANSKGASSEGSKKKPSGG